MNKKKAVFLSSHYEYLEFKKNRQLKSFIIITNSPKLLSFNSEIISLKQVIGKNNLFLFDSHTFRFEYSKILKNIDHIINKKLKNNFDIFCNTIHQQTKFLSYSVNYYLFFEQLFKKYKIDKFYYYQYVDNNKIILNHELEIFNNVVEVFKENKKIRFFKLIANHEAYQRGNFEKNINRFSTEDYNLKHNIYSSFYNFKSKLFSPSKKNLCLMNLSKDQLKFFYQEFSDKYNLILFNNYIKEYKKDKTLISKSLFDNYLKQTNIEKLFKLINVNKTLLKVFSKYFYTIYKKFYDKYHFSQKIFKKLNQELKFEKFIYGLELPLANYIKKLFNEKNISSLALSHGGTIGHYDNWPCVYFYLVNNKKSYYQVFSQNFKKDLRKVLKIYNNKNVNQFVPIPHFGLHSLIKSDFYKFNKTQSTSIKKILYICSPNFNTFDLKQGVHENYNLLNLRKKIINIFKNKKSIQLTIKNYNGENFLFDEKINKYNNIKYIKSGEIKNLKNEYDLFILESESTALIETLCVNKNIICLRRKFPKLSQKTFISLKGRVRFCKNELSFLKKIITETKNINKRVYNNNFVINNYDLKNINIENLRYSINLFIQK